MGVGLACFAVRHWGAFIREQGRVRPTLPQLVHGTGEAHAGTS